MLISLFDNDNDTEKYPNLINGSRVSSEYDDVLRDIFTTARSSSNGNGSSTDASILGSQHTHEENGKLTSKLPPVQNNVNGQKCNKNQGNMDDTESPSKVFRPLHYLDNNDDRTTQQPPPPATTATLTSRLGKRIMQQYQEQLNPMTDSPPPPSSCRSLQDQTLYQQPSIDFLRLPPPYSSSSSSKMQQTNHKYMEELERQVIQYHLDMQAFLQPLILRHDDDDDDDDDSQFANRHNHHRSVSSSECFTRLLERDPKLGLGMSLREYDGCIYVQALLQKDGSWFKEENGTCVTGSKGAVAMNAAGPGSRAGILPGDRLIGLNGRPFLRGRLASDYKNTIISSRENKYSTHDVPSSEEVMSSVRDAISNATSPMLLHVQRLPDREKIVATLQKLHSKSKDDGNTPKATSNRLSYPTSNATKTLPPVPAKLMTTPSKWPRRGPIIHKFALALSNRGIIQKGREENTVTMQLRLLTDRTRQWESKLSFRLRASDFTLRPQLDTRDVEQSYYASFITDEGGCPPFFDYKFSKSIRSYAPSTPMIQDWRLSQYPRSGHSPIPRVSNKVTKEAAIMADLYAGLDKDDADVQDFLLGGTSSASTGDGEGAAYPAFKNSASDIFVPLVGVRKAMCVRILNSFLDNQNQTAFTIWCYDVESGQEWYAPVRYYNDFKDLRVSLLRLDKTIADIPFPSLGWGLKFSIETTGESSAKSKELRRSQLEIFLRQVFVHVYRGRLHPCVAEVAVHLQTFVGCDTVLGEEGGGSGLSLSKQVAVSESTYGKRLPDPKSEPDNNARRHLKRSVMRYVYRLFLLPSIERLIANFVDATREIVMSDASSQQFSVSKSEARASIEKIRDFIDKLQELILDGCHDDFVSIAQRRDFAALVDDSDNLIRDDLFREAVREQIEIEVYVPLRSTISKYLVYAWFNEDMEMKHKMKVNTCLRGTIRLLLTLVILTFFLVCTGIDKQVSVIL